MRPRLRQALATGAIVALALAACGREPAGEARRGEVIARVNGDEITARQLDERMELAGLRPEDDASSSRRKHLDALVDERLLVQEALAAGLDREPHTRAAIEQARSRLLASAAVDASPAAGVTDGQAVRHFFDANPDLFAQRKVYTFRRFSVEADIDRPTRARLDASRTPQAVAAILRRAGLAHAVATRSIAAEALPPAILARAGRMRTGDILLVTEGRRTVLLQLADSIREPMTLEAAAPAIGTYLAGLHRQQQADRLLLELRRRARIEYVTQAASAPGSAAIAQGKPALDEPALRRPIQSPSMTVVR
jgi:EpsD family peptidyl-prolyl cis-trans isomerase